MSRTALLVVLCCVFLDMWSTHSVQAKPTPALKSCGPALVLRIARVCEGRYYAPRRVRRGIVDDCCSGSCTDEALEQYCNRNDQVEESPEELVDVEAHESIGSWPESSTAATATIELMTEFVAEAEVKKSRLQIGRVPRDFFSGWTYSG